MFFPKNEKKCADPEKKGTRMMPHRKKHSFPALFQDIRARALEISRKTWYIIFVYLSKTIPGRLA